MTERVISVRDECAFKIWKLLPAAEKALDDYLTEESHFKCSGKMQVLLTKVSR